MRLALFAPIALACVTAATPAHAAYLVQLTEANGDVVAKGSGTLNLSGLQLELSNLNSGGQLWPNQAALVTGRATGISLYTGARGPSSFGAGTAFVFSTANSGDGVGIFGSRGFVYLPSTYNSGTQLASESLFRGTSFAQLGVTAGTYTYNWGTATDDETFTVQIGPAAAAGVPEPAAWAMMIGGFGLVGGSLRRRTARTRVRFA